MAKRGPKPRREERVRLCVTVEPATAEVLREVKRKRKLRSIGLGLDWAAPSIKLRLKRAKD